MKSKQYLLILILVVFLIVFYMLWYIAKHAEKQHIEISQITHIELINLNSNMSSVFQSNKPVIVLYFNTSCQHCIDEINSISENIEQFNKVKLFLVSAESQDRIAKFSSDFEIDKRYFFHDQTGKLREELNVESYPSIFIFSKDRKLIKQFKGAVPIDIIISEIPNE